MEDTPVSIIGIILAAVLMFIVPFVLLAERNDDISQLIISTATADFVDNVIKTGKITSNEYQKFVSNLQSSGNIYDVDIEVRILDENTAKVVTDKSPTTLGNNTYYSIYTTQIEDMISVSDDSSYNLDGKLILKQGDIVSVTVKNSSTTLSQELKGFYYKITGSDLNILVATETGVVAINGST